MPAPCQWPGFIGLMFYLPHKQKITALCPEKVRSASCYFLFVPLPIQEKKIFRCAFFSLTPRKLAYYLTKKARTLHIFFAKAKEHNRNYLT